MADERRQLGVALSGGGHRAALFGLGALLYLVDAKKGPDLACVSSVSGGSITNAWAGLRTDLRTVDPAVFRQEMRRVARAAATRGTVWSAPLTWAYLLSGVVLAVAGAVVVAAVEAGWLRLLVAAGTLGVLGLLALRRGWVCAKALERALYGQAGLDRMHTAVDHVLCATDLQSAEPLYFSGRFVCSWRHGWGVPGGLRLSRAVQASAALPGAFPPAVLPARRHRFQAGQTANISRLLLSDGGVYDNMATEWPTAVARRNADWQALGPGLQVPEELVVVNGSAGLRWRTRRSPRVPWLAELTSLLAVKDVLYDQTTAVRRRGLLRRFWMSEAPAAVRHGEPALDGAMVQIDRSPFAVPHAFADGHDDRATRAKAALEHLADESEATWDGVVEHNHRVKTALSKIDRERAAWLLRHSYVLTMVNAHVLLDYPLVPIPPLDAFADLAT